MEKNYYTLVQILVPNVSVFRFAFPSPMASFPSSSFVVLQTVPKVGVLFLFEYHIYYTSTCINTFLYFYKILFGKPDGKRPLGRQVQMGG
jgi:hypothetical protein